MARISHLEGMSHSRETGRDLDVHAGSDWGVYASAVQPRSERARYGVGRRPLCETVPKTTDNGTAAALATAADLWESFRRNYGACRPGFWDSAPGGERARDTEERSGLADRQMRCPDHVVGCPAWPVNGLDACQLREENCAP